MYSYDEIYASNKKKIMENVMTSENVGHLLWNMLAQKRRLGNYAEKY